MTLRALTRILDRYPSLGTLTFGRMAERPRVWRIFLAMEESE